MEINIADAINRQLGKAANATGTLTGLISISIFGLAALALPLTEAGFVTLAVFGAVGALEVVHRQAQAEFAKRYVAVKVDSRDRMILEIAEHKGWNPKCFKELSHGGVGWMAIGFEEFPMPITVTGPFCPTCASKLTERCKVRFPGRTSITFACSKCGFSLAGHHTAAELKEEAHHLAGTLVDS